MWTWSHLLGQAGRPGPLADGLAPATAGWMDEGMLSRWLLAPYPAEEMEAYPVGPHVNNARNDDPGCVEPAV